MKKLEDLFSKSWDTLMVEIATIPIRDSKTKLLLVKL